MRPPRRSRRPRSWRPRSPRRRASRPPSPGSSASGPAHTLSRGQHLEDGLGRNRDDRRLAPRSSSPAPPRLTASSRAASRIAVGRHLAPPPLPPPPAVQVPSSSSAWSTAPRSSPRCAPSSSASRSIAAARRRATSCGTTSYTRASASSGTRLRSERASSSLSLGSRRSRAPESCSGGITRQRPSVLTASAYDSTPGGVAERLNAPALKAGGGRQVPRGFESHPLRLSRGRLDSVGARAGPAAARAPSPTRPAGRAVRAARARAGWSRAPRRSACARTRSASSRAAGT